MILTRFRKERTTWPFENLTPWRPLICSFIEQTNLKQTYIWRLDVNSVARDSRRIYQQFAFSIFMTSQAFISSLLVALLPFFNIIGPPHPWIFHPIRGLSTSNGIDEYVQRFMDGDYLRVACNIHTRTTETYTQKGPVARDSWIILLKGSVFLGYACVVPTGSASTRSASTGASWL